MKSFIWQAIVTAMVLTGCSGGDIEAEIAKCKLQGYSDVLATCMSAQGYDFKYGEDSCGSIPFDYGAAGWERCYEKRGIWRSTKQSLKNLNI